ncbi:MAG: hypothetical protein CL678_12225 [Bdellovibrionaceae bacterium]|nr:hypothetical protein [Pseudobdellovibrionaceae bacterium]|tara:strand:+ start:1042 stop:1389 length:348 start_codon:yes stop_codon:yes gene_type:complete
MKILSFLVLFVSVSSLAIEFEEVILKHAGVGYAPKAADAFVDTWQLYTQGKPGKANFRHGTAVPMTENSASLLTSFEKDLVYRCKAKVIFTGPVSNPYGAKNAQVFSLKNCLSEE